VTDHRPKHDLAGHGLEPDHGPAVTVAIKLQASEKHQNSTNARKLSMSSIRTFVSAAASTIGPDAKSTSSNRAAEARRIDVASVKEEHIVISQLDQVLFETFGKDSPVIPAGCVESRNRQACSPWLTN
jgi:hypothetical protein